MVYYGGSLGQFMLTENVMHTWCRIWFSTGKSHLPEHQPRIRVEDSGKMIPSPNRRNDQELLASHGQRKLHSFLTTFVPKLCSSRLSHTCGREFVEDKSLSPGSVGRWIYLHLEHNSMPQESPFLEMPSVTWLGSTKLRVVHTVFPDQNMGYVRGKRH